MSDSIDRVFAHALQTVRKIPRASANNGGGSPSTTNSATSRRPPTEDRLRLYGLYKQSMEGDVLGVMERPTGKTEADKWDAWRAVGGMRKTEAKRWYIESLIETMKKYASDTTEARELVSELEFVWDQVKNNATNSRGHSASHSLASNTFPSTTTIPSITDSYHNQYQGQPQQQLQQPQRHSQMLQLQMPYPTTTRPPSPKSAPVTRYRQEPSRPPDYLLEQGYQSSGDYEHLINPGQPYYEHSRDGHQGSQSQQPQSRYLPLRRMKVGSRGTRSIQSQSECDDDEEVTEHEVTADDDEEDDDDDVGDDDDELFDEQPINTHLPPHHQDHFNLDDDEEYEQLDSEGLPSRLIMGRDTSPDMGTTRWQLRVERALTKMSAEIAALREQLEVRNTQVLQSSGSWLWPGAMMGTDSTRSVVRRKGGEVAGIGGRGKRWGRVLWQVVWNVCRHLMVDAVVVGIVVWWMGRRGEDRRAGEVLRWLGRLLRGRRRKVGGSGGGGGEGGGHVV